MAFEALPCSPKLLAKDEAKWACVLLFALYVALLLVLQLLAIVNLFQQGA